MTIGYRVQGFVAVTEKSSGPFGAAILGHERYDLVQQTLDPTAKSTTYACGTMAPDVFFTEAVRAPMSVSRKRRRVRKDADGRTV